MNGWTPTPTNKERKDYDFERALLFEARAIAYDVASQHPITEANMDRLHDLLTNPMYDADGKIVTVTKRPTYDELIHGAKFTDEHRAELRDWWNKKYDNREEAKRLNVLR